MKGNSGSGKLSVMTVLFGIAALAMRRALYATAVDVKGLLMRNQPLGIALTVLTLGVPNRFIAQATVAQQTAECALDALSIAHRVRQRLSEIGEAQR